MAYRLLIVEDEDTLRESLERVFSREGYEVFAVSSSEFALKTLEENIYDVIITDIMLPGLNGLELLRRCRKKAPDQIVIIITAYASIETAVAGMRAGAYDYMIKPIGHEEMKEKVKNALKEREMKSRI